MSPTISTATTTGKVFLPIVFLCWFLPLINLVNGDDQNVISYSHQQQPRKQQQQRNHRSLRGGVSDVSMLMGNINNNKIDIDFYNKKQQEESLLYLQSLQQQQQQQQQQQPPLEDNNDVYYSIEELIQKKIMKGNETFIQSNTTNNNLRRSLILNGYKEFGSIESSNDLLGWSIDFNDDGSQIVIGSPEYTNVNGQKIGKVEVYALSGSGESAVWKLKGNAIFGIFGNALLGSAVDISGDGNRIIVSAFGQGQGIGYFLVLKYNRVTDFWDLNMGSRGFFVGDGYGFKVAMSDNGRFAGVSAVYYNDDLTLPANATADVTGLLLVLRYNEITATYDFIQLLFGNEDDDLFGQSISIINNGNIAVGAPSVIEDVDLSTGIIRERPGRVYTYEYLGDILNAFFYKPLASPIEGENNFDSFGTSVDFNADGSRIAVGAVQNGGANGRFRGHVRVFEFIDSTWEQLGRDINGEEDFDSSGWSVSLSAIGDTVLIGSPVRDIPVIGGGIGKVRLYTFNGGDWELKQFSRQNVKGVNGEQGLNFGFSVALSSNGNKIAVAQPGDVGANSTETVGPASVFFYGTTEYPTFSPIEHPIKVVTNDSSSGNNCCTRIGKAVKNFVMHALPSFFIGNDDGDDDDDNGDDGSN